MLDTLPTFVAVVFGLFLIPGPAVLLVLTRTAQGGRRTGIATGAGIAVGDFLHSLLAAVGLSAVLMTSASAFTAVKLCGAGYLLYLGVRALLEKPAAGGDAAAPAARPVVTPSRAFWQAIPAEVLNPKTALFFLAFMPQFVRAEHGHVFAQFMVLGLVFVAMSMLFTTGLVYLAGPLGRLASRLSWLKRWQGKMIGSIFIGLGLRVALQKQ